MPGEKRFCFQNLGYSHSCSVDCHRITQLRLLGISYVIKHAWSRSRNRKWDSVLFTFVAIQHFIQKPMGNLWLYSQWRWQNIKWMQRVPTGLLCSKSECTNEESLGEHFFKDIKCSLWYSIFLHLGRSWAEGENCMQRGRNSFIRFLHPSRSSRTWIPQTQQNTALESWGLHLILCFLKWGIWSKYESSWGHTSRWHFSD